MIPLLFFPQGATAPVGGYGGITLTQAGSGWQGTAWYGGKNIKTIPTQTSIKDVLQAALVVLVSYNANLNDTDPDN